MFWLPRGHFSARFCHKRGHFSVRFCHQRGHFSVRFGSQECSLSCFNQPRGQLSMFCQIRGHFSAHFGSQEGTLSCVFQQLGHGGLATAACTLQCFCLTVYSWCPYSVGLWVSGGHCDQPGVAARPLPDPLHQEVVFPQSADLLHRPGHRDSLLQCRASAHTRGL